MTGFSHKTLENSLLKVLQSSGTVPTHFPYPVWKFSRQIVQIFSEIITNMDESGLPIFDWIPAVVIWHDRLLPAKCWPLLHVIAGISARSLRFEGNKIHCSPRDQSLSVNCYTSQLKYVFWLEENVSRVVGQNSLTLSGNNNLNFGLARDQVVLLETAINLWASRRQANDFFAVYLYFF